MAIPRNNNPSHYGAATMRLLARLNAITAAASPSPALQPMTQTPASTAAVLGSGQGGSLIEHDVTPPPSATKVLFPDESEADQTIKEVTENSVEDQDDKDDWIDADGVPEKLKFREATVKIVPIDELVWAPLYRYNDKLFPARMCRNEEALSLEFVKVWPLPKGAVVVEILCQPDFKSASAKLVVKSEKIMPFWTNWNREKTDTPPRDLKKTEWSTSRMAALHKALETRHSKRDCAGILKRIQQVASEFLQKAKEHEDDLAPIQAEGGEVQDNASDSPPGTPGTSQTLYVDVFAMARSPAVSEKDKVLRLGDRVQYRSKISNAMVITRITGFSSDAKFPLLLENEERVRHVDYVSRIDEGEGGRVGPSLLLEKYHLDDANCQRPPASAAKTIGSASRKRSLASETSETESTPCARSRRRV